eukprot:3752927-Alexandrium_andersonii.AAC.1
MRHHGREPALEEGTKAPSTELGQAPQVAALLGDALLEEHPGDTDAGRVVVARVSRLQTEAGYRVQVRHAAPPTAP